jgi:protein TonB
MTNRDSYEPPENEWQGAGASPLVEERAPFRLPTEMPLPPGESRKMGLGISIAIHALIVLMFLLPLLMTPAGRSMLVQGAGGPGAAGGGGGGMGPREGVRYVRVAPEPTPKPTTTSSVTAPVVTPPVTPPVVQPPPVKTPPPEVTPPSTATSSPDATSAGGGSGSATGAGPGTGGGIGSGVGTGTGSSTGPGTGGGSDSTYPPQPISMPLPPQPVPKSIRGLTIVAEFDVDSTGRVVKWDFKATPDGGYNRKLKGLFGDLRFRPGVRPDGSPVRSKGQVTFTLY